MTDEQSEVRLLPCPFCGEAPETGITGAPECDNWRYVQCANNYCNMRHTLFGVITWNTRTAPSVTTPVSTGEQIAKILNEDRCMFCGGKTAHEPDCSHGVRPAATSTPVDGEQDLISRKEVITRLERQIRLWNNDTVTMACADMLAELKSVPATTPTAASSVCDYCAAPQHFTPASELPNQEGLWHRSELGGHYRCTATAASSECEQEQTWCDHCSADLNGVRHILCERCYREFANSTNTRESLRTAILDWLAHRCDYAPVCGNCAHCRVAGFVRSVEITAAAPSSEAIRAAAEEIHESARVACGDSLHVTTISAIVTKHFNQSVAAPAAPSPAELRDNADDLVAQLVAIDGPCNCDSALCAHWQSEAGIILTAALRTSVEGESK